MVPSTLNFARGSSSKKSESAMLTETFGTCFKNTCDHTSAAAYKTETKTFQRFICSKVRTLQMYTVKFETRWKTVHWALVFSGHYFARRCSKTFFQLFFQLFFNFFQLFWHIFWDILEHFFNIFHIVLVHFVLNSTVHIYLQCRVGGFSLTCLATKVCTLVTFNKYWVSEFL